MFQINPRKLISICLFTLLIGGAIALFRLPNVPLPKANIAPPHPKQATQSSPVSYAVTSVVDGLYVPWSIVFTAKDRWLVSERSGSIRIVQSGKLVSAPLATFTVSSQSEEGLMGLALDPDYVKNKQVYACYASLSNGTMTDRVVKFEDKGNLAGPPTTLIDAIPAAVNHAGCRLSFGPSDQKLYITTGDATNKAYPQNFSSLGGKILRINSDGSIPQDNPVAGSPLWTLGHRNPQGLAWQPGTNQLFATEHGPSGNDGPPGGDELNIIQKGANYGWPIISHDKTDSRFVTPLLIFTPAVAPAGAMFYNSNVLSQFKNNLLFAALKGEGVYRVVFDQSSSGKILSHQKISDIDIGRVRDVQQGPDGFIYLLTSNRDGRGTVRSGDDKIYRVSPK